MSQRPEPLPPVASTGKRRQRGTSIPENLRDLSTKWLRPVARFAVRHWIRHDELVRLRQQVRYLSLAHLLARLPEPPLDLTLFELSVFSQNGEDGVLQEILRRIGVEKRSFVEIGASVNESNCLLLADALGWSGLFIDAAEEESDDLRRKYRAVPEVSVLRTFITAENLEETLRQEGVENDLDVLSIDVDGNDYWLWAALAEYRPRVVIIEYNASLPHDEPVIQPYDPAKSWDGTDAFGSSIDALRRLGRERGYRLVHTDLSGTNAFFVRDDLAETRFSEGDATQTRGPNYFLYGLNHREAQEPLSVETGGMQDIDETKPGSGGEGA